MVILNLIKGLEFDFFRQSGQSTYTLVYQCTNYISRIYLERKQELMTAYLQKRPIIIEHYHLCWLVCLKERAKSQIALRGL